MFEQIYSDIKTGKQQSRLRFFFQYSALGQLLEHHTTVDAVTFYDTCLSSWRWNRLWFRSFIQDSDYLKQFDTVLDSLWLLKKAKILTPENLALVANYPHPADLAIMFSHLQQAAILTPENFLLIARHAHPTNLASAFSHLQQAGILTQENFWLVAWHAHPADLAIVSSHLQKAEILTPENFLRVARHAHPEHVVSAFSYLQRAEILTPENLALVVRHARPTKLISAFSYLQTAGILTQKNFALIARHANPDILASAFSYLQKTEILTPENRILVTNHASPTNLAYAFAQLQTAGILTPENQTLVAKQENPYSLALAFSHLQTAGILTPENLMRATEHAHTKGLAYAFYHLQKAGILTQENFDLLIASRHTALTAAETEELIWSTIPSYLLTQNNFERLVTAAKQANPMAALQRALDLILLTAFNPAQSTHTASVHRSVSASAARLMKNYGTDLNLAATIEKIKSDVNGLDDSFEHLAAKRGIKRIASPDNTFTDSSGVTTHQLLALAYLAIHDESRRQGTLEEAQALFIDGLYEIQRGYNLNAQGIDNQSPDDAPICLAGTFTKLMEKINGIHPDVELCFITHEGLGLKFPKVVKDCVCNHLHHLASPETATGYVMIKKLLDGMKDNGLEPIWDKIKAAVEARLWDEFKEAYANNPEHPRFSAMINNGHYSNAPDLTAFYAQLEASPGYEAFLYQLQQKNLAEQQFFFRANRHALWANRHHGTDDPKAFNREFALVLKP